MHTLIHRFHCIHRRLRVWLILSITIVFLTIAIHPVHAQQSSPVGNQVDGYPVVLDGNVLFRVRQGIPGIASAEERANIINGRLASIANDDAISPETIRVEEQEDASVVLVGDTVLFTVRESDRVGNQSRQATAANSVQIMQSAVTQYRQDRSIEQIVRGILFAVLSTIALIGFLVFLQRFISRLLIKIRAARRADALDVRIQNFQLLGSGYNPPIVWQRFSWWRLPAWLLHPTYPDLIHPPFRGFPCSWAHCSHWDHRLLLPMPFRGIMLI